MNKLKKIFLNKEAFMYVVFGVLTTLIDYIAAMFCFTFWRMGEVASNNIAWVISVVFAYITNKIFVFESKSFEIKVLFKEMISFLSARVITLIMADIIIWTATKFHIGFLLAKIISSVIVIVANYIFSKLIIFKKDNQEEVQK